MLVRYLVSNYLRSAAGQAVRDKVETAVSEKAQDLQQLTDDREIPNCEIALVFASHVEATGVLDQLEKIVSVQCAGFVEHTGNWNGLDVVVIEAGDSWKSIARATTAVINLYQPQWIVSAGFCCALHPKFRKGGIVMPNRVLDTQNRRLDVGFKISEQAVKETKGLYVGELLTVSEMLDTPKKRKQMHKQTGAVVADMESSVIMEICRQASVKCMSVRVITEELDEQPPELMSRMMKQGTKAGKLGALSKGVFTKIAGVKEMWDMKNAAYLSSERLAKFLFGVIEQLVKTTEPTVTTEAGLSEESN